MIWEVWETEEDQNQDVEIEINGETKTYPVEEVTADLILELAKDEGMRKFKVTKNGNEVDPADFDVTAGDKIKIERYDAPGN